MRKLIAAYLLITAALFASWQSLATSITTTGAGTPGGVASYTPQGITFSSTAWSNKATAMTGATASASGVMSAWIQDTHATGANYMLFEISNGSTQPYFQWFILSTGVVVVLGVNAGGTQTYTWNSTTNFASGGWHHILNSFNLTGTPTCQNYVDDVVQTGTGIVCLATQTVNWAGSQIRLGLKTDGTIPYNNNAADIQLYPGVVLDLSVTANRRLFIDGSGNAVNPTVAAAALGAPLFQASGAAATWPLNGSPATGGAFAVQAGTFTNAGTNPP